MITVSIAVNKVDKSKFFTKKNGDKMLDLVLIETPNSKYDNDYMVVQGRTKEEREKDPRARASCLATPRSSNARAATVAQVASRDRKEGRIKMTGKNEKTQPQELLEEVIGITHGDTKPEFPTLEEQQEYWKRRKRKRKP